MPWQRSCLVVLALAASARAGDWPQWLGPQRDGVSTEKVAPWKTDPKVEWRVPVGEGHSSPVVAGGKVFLHAKIADRDEEEVLALDARTGKELWRTPYPRGTFNNVFGNGPRGTPSVVGDRVVTFGVTGILTCLQVSDGKILWQVNTAKEFQAPIPFFGCSCSPLVAGGRVFVNVGGKGASVVAFSLDKGEVVWKALDDKASYSSPILAGKGAERQLIFLTEQGLASLDPESGKIYWQFPMKDKLSESSTTPVVIGDGLLASSVTLGSFGLQLKSVDGQPTATQSWKNPALTCYFSTPVPVGKDTVYLVTGSLLPPPKALLHCVDVKTGKDLWKTPKVVGKYHTTLLRTGDDKLLMLEEAGSLVLVDPDPKEYRELARSKVCGETWAHPALANGMLYVRDKAELIALRLGE